MPSPRRLSVLKAPFYDSGRLNVPALALFLIINGLVLVNAVIHDPAIGYDASHHLRYIRILPQHFPRAEETPEYFSPPLPYLLPSLIDEACLLWNGDSPSSLDLDPCLRLAGKSAQVVNVLLSLGVTFLILRIGEVVHPGSRSWKIGALLLLGLMTAYYRTFAQVRGEPYVALFTIWAIYLLARITIRREVASLRTGVELGVILGLLGLSRQWGFMLFPAVAGLVVVVWLVDRVHRRHVATALLAGLGVAVLVSGWFYLGLYMRHGTFAAFNRSPGPFALSNLPASFYRNTGLKDLWLFRSPVRGTFDNQFLPTLYSDLWGDYWGYFTLIPDRASLADKRYELNAESMTPYLGRVNAAALLPSLVFVLGVATGMASALRRTSGTEEKGRSLFAALLLMFAGAAIALYLAFLIIFTTVGPDSTNKATYVLHVLMVLPLLGASFLERFKERFPFAYTALLAALVLVWLHNAPAMITRYTL